MEREVYRSSLGRSGGDTTTLWEVRTRRRRDTDYRPDVRRGLVRPLHPTSEKTLRGRYDLPRSSDLKIQVLEYPVETKNRSYLPSVPELFVTT